MTLNLTLILITFVRLVLLVNCSYHVQQYVSYFMSIVSAVSDVFLPQVCVAYVLCSLVSAQSSKHDIMIYFWGIFCCCCSDAFLPQRYVPRLARHILECLQRAHDLIAGSQDCSLEFVSRLVGKLCLTGYAGVRVILWVFSVRDIDIYNIIMTVVLFFKSCDCPVYPLVVCFFFSFFWMNIFIQ